MVLIDWNLPGKCALELARQLSQAFPGVKVLTMGLSDTPEDILEAVARGVDMFDCVMPTRNGRHGMAFTRFGQINLRNARHIDDPRALTRQATARELAPYAPKVVRCTKAADVARLLPPGP